MWLSCQLPPAPRSVKGTGNGDRQMRLAGACRPDQDDIALIGDERVCGEVADQRFVDRRVGKIEVLDVLGQGQLGYGELVFDGACLTHQSIECSDRLSDTNV